MRMVLKLEPFFNQFIPIGFRSGFTFRQEAFQYTAIFSQCIIHIPDKVISYTIELIIISSPAIIIAKLFIAAAFYWFAATDAVPGFILL
jgi:hypothetical protein